MQQKSSALFSSFNNQLWFNIGGGTFRSLIEPGQAKWQNLTS